jgi:hypothetical protein
MEYGKPATFNSRMATKILMFSPHVIGLLSFSLQGKKAQETTSH